MKKFAVILASAAVSVFAAGPAQADVFTYANGDDGYYFLDSALGSPAAETAFVSGIVGTTVTYLNKYDYGSGFDDTGAVDQAGSGPFNQGAAGGSSSKSISWDLSGSGFGVTYILIKDGTVDEPGCTPTAPGVRPRVDCEKVFLYRLYGVTAAQLVDGDGEVSFLPDYNKNISHISWFGRETTDEEDPGTPVPDGGTTLTLLGGALLGIGAIRRKFSA